ncbi:hypothetical protein LG293_17690 (plasmid) [Citricoccus nitrophenolicus]
MAQRVLSKSWLAENPKGEEQASFTLLIGDQSFPKNPDGSTSRVKVTFTGNTWGEVLAVGQSLQSVQREGSDEMDRSKTLDLIVGAMLQIVAEKFAESGLDPKTSSQAEASAWFNEAEQAERDRPEWESQDFMVGFTPPDGNVTTVVVSVLAPGIVHAMSALEELSLQLGDDRVSLMTLAIEACTAGGAGRDRGYDSGDEVDWEDEDNSVLVLD